MRKILFAALLPLLAACSGGSVTDTLHADATPQNLTIETAKYFETSRSRVAVGNLKPGILGTSYKARVAGTMYDCHYVKKAVSCDRA